MAQKLSLLVLFLYISLLTHAQQNMLWKFPTNGRIYSSPAIDGDLLFLGSGDSSLYAVNKRTGKKMWEYRTEGAVHSSPAVYGNFVYFGSADGNLYALSKKDGKLKWRFRSAGEKMYDIWDYYLSSPKEYMGPSIGEAEMDTCMLYKAEQVS